jgi:hypothetical protein
MSNNETPAARQDENPAIRALSTEELRRAGGGSGIQIPIKVKHNL